MKEEEKTQQIEKIKSDVGEGKNVELFSSPLIREQLVEDMVDLEIDDEEEIQIEDDVEEQREYDSFERFLKSQGLKQEKGKDPDKNK